MRDKRYTSTVISWKKEKGYGFIGDPSGEADLFLHINDIRGKEEPTPGDIVSFELHTTRQGKVVTANAHLLAWHMRILLTCKRTIVFSVLPFVLSIITFDRSYYPFLLYTLMSFVCFLMYNDDKRRAENEEWRIPDNSIHLVQLLWGWPGALIAQKVYYHKARKKSFQGTLRFIIFVHLTFWTDYLLLDHIILKTIAEIIDYVANL